MSSTCQFSVLSWAQPHPMNVREQWVDFNGHMSEACYIDAMGERVNALLAEMGIDEEYHAAGGSVFAQETRISYLNEVLLGEQLLVRVLVLNVNHRRLHVYCEMTLGRDGSQVAEVEQIMTHVDLRSRRSAAWPDAVYGMLNEVMEAHREQPRSAFIGQALGLRTPSSKY